MCTLRVFLALATLLVAPAAAQDFPAAGEGAFSWAPLGERTEGYEIVFTESGTPLVFESSGGHRFEDGGWTEFDWINAIGSVDVALPLGGDTLIVGLNLARTLDGGDTWEFPCGTAGENSCERAYEDSSHNIDEITTGPYAGRLLAGGALYSDDRGASWQTASVDANETNWLFRMRAFAPLPSGRVLGAGEWGIGVSEDGGVSWAPGPLFAPYGFSGYGIAEFAMPGSVQAHDAGGPTPDCGRTDMAECEGAVWFGTSTQAVGVRTYWTNDGGRSWTEGSPLDQIYDTPGWGRVVFVRELDRSGTGPSGAGLGRGLAMLAGGWLQRSTDGGVTWEVVARSASIGAEPEDGGIMLSAELGPDGHLYTVQVQSGLDEYVWVTEEPAAAALDFVVSSDAAPVEQASIRAAVSPNPSRASAATVRVARPALPSAVRVEVFDSVGRRVAVLHEGAARGDLSLDLDTSRFAAGTYRVVVTADGARASRAFTVAR